MTSFVTVPATDLPIADLPKVSLHDHLDGGLRPQTLIELAAEAGHVLPSSDAATLAQWFVSAADSGSLVRYLETFDHTVAAMQTAEALERVAREAVVDLANDGVIHAELRWAPEQHLTRGLTLQGTVEAVARGIEQGIAEAAAGGREISAGQLVTAMRHTDRWEEIARLAVANRDAGVLGFDIAGAEKGFLPSRFPQVWEYFAEEEFPVTIHAGEADGVESIKSAIVVGRALRLGHGVRIVEDIDLDGSGPRYGRTAAWVRDRQIPLETSPSSNVQTGAAPSIAGHQISLLRDLDFAVTINTDNRLVSGTSYSREYALLVTEAGWSGVDLLNATLTAAWNAFVDHDARGRLAERVTEGFAAAGIDWTGQEAQS